HAFAIFNQMSAWRNPDEAKACRHRENERECANPKPPPPCRESWRERQVAKRNQNQRPFGSDERQEKNAKKRGRQRRTDCVISGGPANAALGATRGLDETTESHAHENGRQQQNR